MKIKINGKEISCTKAVKGSDFIELFDGNNCFARYSGISSFDGYVLIEGEWTLPEPTPDENLESLRTQMNQAQLALCELYETILAGGIV